MKYRRKAQVVEAMQWDGTVSGAYELHEFTNYSDGIQINDDGTVRLLNRERTDVRAVAEHGDWIIRGVQGGYFRMPARIFAATYEVAE
jgi:hypothetical protein